MASVNNSLVKKEEEKETISTYFMKDLVRKKVIEMVGSTNAQRFMTSIISSVSNNPSLAECDYGSIVSAALLAESLNLSLNSQIGQCYMVPYNCKIGIDQKGETVYAKKAQFQIGYKGYIQLMKRSGIYKRLNVIAIKEGEFIKYDPLNEELEVKFIEDDEIREQTPTVGYYAMFEEKNGFIKTLYWTKKKMLLHADKYSQAFSMNETTIKTKYGTAKKVSYADYEAGKYNKNDEWMYSSFWYQNFDDMAFKTMLRQLISKWGTMSIEMQYLQEAYTKDMTVLKENGEYEYIDNTEETPILGEAEIVPQEPEKETTPEKNKTDKKAKTSTKKVDAVKPTTDKEVIKNEVSNEVVQDEEEDDDPFASL